MALRPGSSPWLLKHEIRLAWRGGGRLSGRVLLTFAVVLSVVLHAAAYVLLSPWDAQGAPAWVTFVIGGVAWIAISFMLAQAILLSVSAVFDRGDLDLLLASPLSTRTVFMVRGLGVAVGVGALYLFVFAPFAHVGLFLGHPSLLAVYPALGALVLGATALGLGLTLVLVRALGARRARTVAQVLGSLVGGAIVLLSQLPNLMGPDGGRRIADTLVQWVLPGGPLAPEGLFWFPGRALLGEPLPLLAVLAAGAGSFWLVVHLAHGRYLAGTQESVAGSARRGVAAPRAGSTRFRSGLWRNVLVKEWRLIARDPQLIAQTLLHLLYLAPLMFVMAGQGFRAGQGEANGAGLVAAAVFLASALAGNLAWITVAAEDAPELLGTAPCAAGVLRWAKVLAALLPVWALLSPAIVYLLATRAGLGLVCLLCVVGGTVSAGVVQVWYPTQGHRKDLKTRARGHLAVNLVESLTAAAWAGTAYCLIAAPLLAPLPLIAALSGSAAVWRLGRPRREALVT